MESLVKMDGWMVTMLYLEVNADADADADDNSGSVATIPAYALRPFVLNS